MTETDIIEAVHNLTGLQRKQAKAAYETIFSGIKTALIAGKTIELRGVGTFETRLRSSRKKVRDPKTGEYAPVYRHREVSFRPCANLKQAVWKE